MDTKSQKILTKKTLVSTKVSKSSGKSPKNDSKDLKSDSLIKEDTLEEGASREDVLESDASVGGLVEKSAAAHAEVDNLNAEILEAIEKQDLVNPDGSIKKDTVTTLKALGSLTGSGKKDVNIEGEKEEGEAVKEVSDLNKTALNYSVSEDIAQDPTQEDSSGDSPEDSSSPSPFRQSSDRIQFQKIPLNKKKLSTAPLSVLLPELGDVFELSNSIEKFQARQTELKQRMIDRDSEAGKELYAEETMLSQVLNWLQSK